MKTRHFLIAAVMLFTAVSCQKIIVSDIPAVEDDGPITLQGMARVFSELPLQREHLLEVHDAVCSSASNGFDEEYLMSDLLSSPGTGVGSGGRATKAGTYSRPLKDLLADYFASETATKSSSEAQRYLNSLLSSDMQIYWPFSDSWDGETFPLVTFDPGYGADSNYGYEISFDQNGARVVDSVYVDESVAARRPVWVLNRNDDSAFRPLEVFRKDSGISAPVPSASSSPAGKQLLIKSFRMLHNYDSWFAGASEFFFKCGSVDGFKATKEEDLRLYTPSVTDFMVSVRRSQVNKDVPLDCLLLTDFTEQIDKIAFLVIEDDGGTSTSWKCSATVKYKSKSYGFDVEIPYRDKDDIVWRGQLSGDYLRKSDVVTSRFGDTMITFEIR